MVFSYVLKGAYVITRPITKVGEFLLYPFASSDDSEQYGDPSEEIEEEERLGGMTLEGILNYRKGGGSGKRFTWKRRFVVLDMTEGGGLSVFRLHESRPILRQMYTKLHQQMSSGASNLQRQESHAHTKDVLLHIPPNAPWVVKDVPESSSLFTLEISTSGSHHFHFGHDDDDCFDSMSIGEGSFVTNDYSVSVAGEGEHMGRAVRQKLEQGLQKAKRMHKPMRFYFKCPKKGNEKALWLRAFSKLDRLSSEASHMKKPLSALANALFIGDSRLRTPTSAEFARETRQLDHSFGGRESSLNLDTSDVMDDSSRKERVGGTEFRVHPAYAYPHAWMTNKELKAEMEPRTTHFHDLRLDSLRGEEIGLLNVEVLECMGLPKLDRKSETDAVVYLVCGAYAFATDVIKETSNPIWLRKTRRACIFPVFHGYARLYVGVFDDDRGERDDFAGRVCIDLARLRPGSVYDVTLPLRISTHIYSKRPRGAIRLRFQLDWKSERQALLSYIPKKIKIHRDLSLYKPREDVTVMCADEKAFQNIAVTVHGSHLPGKFSYSQFRAILREIALTRKAVMMIVRLTIKETIRWENPAISLFVFLAWMHSVYANQFALAPPYIMCFMLFQLIRCYARYGIDGPAQFGFLPPTWEEMLAAVIGDTDTDSYCIEPLELRNTRPGSTRSGASRSNMSLPQLEVVGQTQSRDVDDFQVSTHAPELKGLLRLCGFLENEVEEPLNSHLEFPYARSTDYPKYTVAESLNGTAGKRLKTIKERKRNSPKSKTSPRSGMASSPRRGRLPSDVLLSNQSHDLFTIQDNSFDVMDDSFTAGDDELGVSSHSFPVRNRLGRSGSNDDWEGTDPGLVATDTSEATSVGPELPLFMQLPEQDIDKEGETTGNKLTDDLSEIKYKMHELTCHLFNDLAYTVKSRDAVFWGHENRASRKSDYDVNRYLDKSLGLGQYSHGNPLVSRIGLYLEPIIGSALSFLCSFRALFNVFTWQDPFLSFWVSVLASIAIVILFVFPWRLFLFLTGLVVFGPQNYVFRRLKERRERITTVGPTPKAAAREEAQVDVEQLLKQQPVIKAHSQREQKPQEVDLKSINRREIHHVVIPYSPLMYQRFYDWPPEPQYSRVKKTGGSQRPQGTDEIVKPSLSRKPSGESASRSRATSPADHSRLRHAPRPSKKYQ